ncbi:FUSC family protein [Sediminitomix flava]|uniref:Fusaric acid resistance family protein n=1 Tax=Sediminitomix flava TaxID=379075 RepID=A0A315ZG40_SEDFL|nr:FUSC family protein [Sediminitomix flava]PWJ43714.1 fusaric acid resistance family protein [Sediminitomix flava]
MKWEDFVRTLNVVIGLSIAHLFQTFLQLDHEGWMYITIIVILAPADDVEKAFKKARHRAIGTSIGGLVSLVGYFILYKLHSVQFYYIVICTGFVLGIYNASKKYPYAATLTSMTIFMANYERAQVLEVAVWRLGNVLLGCLIAYGISFFSMKYFKHSKA